jgi:hypothetical protein
MCRSTYPFVYFCFVLFLICFFQSYVDPADVRSAIRRSLSFTVAQRRPPTLLMFPPRIFLVSLFGLPERPFIFTRELRVLQAFMWRSTYRLVYFIFFYC